LPTPAAPTVVLFSPAPPLPTSQGRTAWARTSPTSASSWCTSWGPARRRRPSCTARSTTTVSVAAGAVRGGARYAWRRSRVPSHCARLLTPTPRALHHTRVTAALAVSITEVPAPVGASGAPLRQPTLQYGFMCVRRARKQLGKVEEYRSLSSSHFLCSLSLSLSVSGFASAHSRPQ